MVLVILKNRNDFHQKVYEFENKKQAHMWILENFTHMVKDQTYEPITNYNTFTAMFEDSYLHMLQYSKPEYMKDFTIYKLKS
jgi:hypothetical protein